MATSDVKYSAIPELTAATISANAELAIPFVLKAGKDLWPDVPVRISVHAETMQKRKPSAQNEAFVELTPSRDAPPQSPSYFPDIPKALHGGINVARTAFGAELVGEYTGAIGNGFENLFDDINVRGLGFTLRGGVAEPYQDIVIRLAGDQPSEIIGTAINLFNKEGSLTDLSHLSMAVSVDGATFTPVLDEPLLPVKVEQYFVLDEPVKARYARLRLQHTFSGSTKQPVSLAEWKVIANGDHDMTAGSGQNLADPTLGGHVVYAKPLVSTHWDKILLTDEKGLIRKRLKPAQQQEMVIGFHHNRAARIARVEWVREEEPRPPEFSAAQVSISLDSPHGPWTVLGALPFENGGKVVTLSPSAAVWARFVKITLPGPESQTTFTYPEQIRIIEQPAGPGYQSILGEWGDASSLATYEETLGPPEYPVPSRATHTSREKARPLTSSQSESGAVSLGNEEHWYRLNLPAGHNKLTLDVSGDPTVRVVVSLLDEAGEEVLLKRQNQRGSADQHIYEAVLQPGSNYYLKVEEPPRNVVFTWDTSASVAPYLPMVYNALVAFADDVVPGRDSVNLVPFGSHLLLDDWQGEPYLLKTILNDYLRNESSSEAEGSMKSSTEALQPIPGTKAIVVMTDNTTNRTAPMWDRFAEVRPRVFGIGVGGGYSANEEQDRFQDWAYVNGGHYKHSNYLADIDVAFDRAATMMRRPAAYQILASSEFVEAPGPGQLSIVAAESGVHFSGGVELILDASGSMLKRLDGERRIAIAKAVLTETVRERLPAGTPTALRVFGHKEPNACRTDLEIPLGPLDPEKAASIIAGIQARNLAKTPIADSLAAIANDMKGTSGKKLVVLVTDGEETCDGNPAEVLEKLASQGIDVSLNIVGFAIDDRELEAQFTDWAELGGGRYYAATDQSALSSALESALKVSYRVYSNAGEQVAEGKLGDQPVMLDQGRYRVVVETGPPITFDSVEIIGEQTTTLSVD